MTASTPGTSPGSSPTGPSPTTSPSPTATTTSTRTTPVTFPPCDVADETFDLIVPTQNLLISRDSVKGARSLLLSWRLGDLLRVFAAVDRAVELLDTDQLCLDSTLGSPGQLLLNRLYCWRELEYRVSVITRRRLVNKVFGIRNPDAPESERDTAIQPMLVRLLDAMNAVCDPGPFRTAPTPADEQRLEFAAVAVQARLSLSMTGLVTMQVRDLQRQLRAATDILTDLATHLQLPCRPGGTTPDMWASLEVLEGDQLRRDGVDLFEAGEQAEAWGDVFDFLAGFGDPVIVPPTPCQAAAVLRPPTADCVPVCLRDSVPRQDQLQ